MIGLLMILAGLATMAFSYGLLIWTTWFRPRDTSEPPWVTRAGCSTSLAAFILCGAGTITAALTI